MTAIYVLRHPQTTWNAEQRYQGRLESPVSAEGRLQSRLAARAFADSPLAAVYSSPLTRALYLARELAQAADSPLVVDQRLTEIAQTPWEGLYLHQIRQRYPDLHDRWYSRPDHVRFSGGESLAAVQDRALSAFGDIFAAHPDESVAVVTHAVVVQALAAAALHLELRYIHRVQVDNAAITTFCGISAPGLLISLNSTDWLYHSPAARACVS